MGSHEIPLCKEFRVLERWSWSSACGIFKALTDLKAFDFGKLFSLHRKDGFAFLGLKICHDPVAKIVKKIHNPTNLFT